MCAYVVSRWLKTKTKTTSSVRAFEQSRISLVQQHLASTTEDYSAVDEVSSAKEQTNAELHAKRWL